MFFHKKLNGLGIKTMCKWLVLLFGAGEKIELKPLASYIDLTMCLFQFEHDYYLKKNMNSFFLGHPFSHLKPSASIKTY